MPLQPGNGMAQGGGRRIRCAVQHVVAGGIEQADVHVQPAAGLAGERLGHETGQQVLLLRDRLDGALEQQRLVARGHRIGAVLQVDLELPGRVFGHRGIGRNALLPARRSDGIGEAAVVVQILQCIHLGAGVALAGVCIARRLRTALGIGHGVEQVELQLHGDHRRQAQRGESLHHALQHRARRDLEQGTVGGVHCQQQLRHRLRRPWHRAERAGDRAADAIGIANGVAQAGFFHRIAGDVGGDQRHRQAHAVAVDLVERLSGDTLAAQHAVGIGQQQVHQRTALDRGQGGGIGAGQGRDTGFGCHGPHLWNRGPA